MPRMEAKIKLPHQKFESWEDLPALVYLVDDDAQAEWLATRLAESNNAYVVRWNWENSLQGHYVGGLNRYPPDFSLRSRFSIDVSISLFNSPALGLCLLVQKPSGTERIPLHPEDLLTAVTTGANE